ncbi:MAG: hypothetical protein KF890_05275, partial [Nitrospira sp.]|nr:hypothetical protein [Nitrospira sp.]
MPRAPVSKLSEFVDANSAKEGTVEFTFPDTITRVTLQLRYGDTESAELPIDLTETSLKPKPVVESEQQSKLRNAQFPIRLRANQEVRLPQANQT